MKLAEFNRAVNPADEACYAIETPTETLPRAKFADIRQILSTRLDVAIRMTVPKGLVVIETECSAVAEAIKSRNEPLMVARKGGRYYVFAKANIAKSTVNNVLACGAPANVITYSRKGTDILLPFHARGNVLPKYQSCEIIHSNGIGDLPLWLKPLRGNSSPNRVGLDLPIVGNAAKLLTDHAMSLTGFGREQKKEVLSVMNASLTATPLNEQELARIVDSLGDAFLETFMTKNEFLHDKFGDYVIEALHIHKDTESGHLFFYDEKRSIYTDDPDFLRGYITKLCPRLKQYQKDEAIKYISDVLECDSVKFNANPFNIVFKNGILHLDEMEFEPMSPDQLESIQINANYDPNAYSETADAFFHNVTCGDADTQKLLFEAIGYAMLKTVELAKSFMMTGTGRNGKSTFIDLVTAILGEKNCASLSLKDMANNFRVSTLVGKLASLAADISSQPIAESDLLKSVSAGDRIMLERKYEQAYEDRVFATLFFACNKLPQTPDTSEGFYRRWVIIPFNADLTKIKNVEGFAFKKALLSQGSLDYIAYKATQAIYELFNTTKDFTQPNSVTTMLAAYKIANSSLLSWFKERFLLNRTDPTEAQRKAGIEQFARMHLPEAYRQYNDWCMETNKKPLARPKFEEEAKMQFGIEWVDGARW